MRRWDKTALRRVSALLGKPCKIGLIMIRDDVDYTCEVVLKTAQETGESGRISRNHWENGGILEKLGENW